MAKQEKKEARYIYKRNPELGKTGFTEFDKAKELETELLKKYAEPEYRVRTRLRTRTNTWDVVVKVRTAVAEDTAAQQKAA